MRGVLASALAAGLLVACARNVDTGRRCPKDSSACRDFGAHAGEAGSANLAGAGSAAGSAGSVGSGDQALVVRVEDIEGMTLEIVTLACGGECVEVEAVVHGGHPPYVLSWEDGFTHARRTVCLEHSSQLTVTVTDTAIESEEFVYEAQSTSATVSATVLECPDAGAGDGGPTTLVTPCLRNPSFEGTAAFNGPPFFPFDVAPWVACLPGTPDVVDEACCSGMPQGYRPPAHGATYVRAGSSALGIESSSQVLCSPISAGERVSFEIDLAADTDESSGGMLMIYGDVVQCGSRELLWMSPEIVGGWKPYCVTLEPTQEITALTFAPSGSYPVSMDNIVAVEGCP